MIKKFKQFNEGINHLLVGPTEEEVINNLNKLEQRKMMTQSLRVGYLDGVKKSLSEHRNFDMNIILQTACFYGYIDIINYLLENYKFEIYVINNIMNLTKKEDVKELLKNYINESSI